MSRERREGEREKERERGRQIQHSNKHCSSHSTHLTYMSMYVYVIHTYLRVFSTWRIADGAIFNFSNSNI